jgi:hypothetical protein
MLNKQQGTEKNIILKTSHVVCVFLSILLCDGVGECSFFTHSSIRVTSLPEECNYASRHLAVCAN